MTKIVNKIISVANSYNDTVYSFSGIYNVVFNVDHTLDIICDGVGYGMSTLVVNVPANEFSYKQLNGIYRLFNR